MDHSGHDDHMGHSDSGGTDMEAPVADSVDKDASASANASESSDGHAGHGMADMDHSEMGMSAFLFTRTNGFYVLFEKAFVTSTGGFIGALVATFAFGVFTTIGYEIGKRIETQARTAKVDGGAKALPAVLLGALGHGFRLLLHYMAMLLVMTMNVWVIIAVLLGHMFGFLLVTLFGKGSEKKDKLSDAECAVGGCDC